MKRSSVKGERAGPVSRGVEPKNPFETSGRRLAAGRGREQRRDGPGRRPALPLGPTAPPEAALALLPVTTPGGRTARASPRGTAALRREESPARPALGQGSFAATATARSRARPSTSREGGAGQSAVQSSPRTHRATPRPRSRPDRAPGSPRSAPSAPARAPATPDQMTRELRAASSPRAPASLRPT